MVGCSEGGNLTGSTSRNAMQKRAPSTANIPTTNATMNSSNLDDPITQQILR